MKKFLFSTICIVLIMSQSIYAETVKSAKKTKSADTNQTMSDDEFMKQFMALDQQVEMKNKKIEELKQTNKTLDEIIDLLHIKNKWKILE